MRKIYRTQKDYSQCIQHNKYLVNLYMGCTPLVLKLHTYHFVFQKIKNEFSTNKEQSL